MMRPSALGAGPVGAGGGGGGGGGGAEAAGAAAAAGTFSSTAGVATAATASSFTGAPPPAALALALASASSSSVSAIKPMGVPTFATSPSGMTMAPRMPLLKLSTSMSALSDSTTTIDSPFLTTSPSCLSHDTILPSVMVDDRAGITTSRTLASVTHRFLVEQRRARTATTLAPEEKVLRREVNRRDDEALRVDPKEAEDAMMKLFIKNREGVAPRQSSVEERGG
mmetsp:Transcript_40653/g.73046  ORF Transcript_40653/g.73046 Transcript_40653/m.73046 type:complete len:225 (+) Transcript_40653:250-924(+)